MGSLYTDADFADLFPTVGQPAESPCRLAMVLVMQVAENLSDRQAADAVRGRIDWKYAVQRLNRVELVAVTFGRRRL